MWSIAQKNGVNANDLIKANNLSNLTIYVGQKLTIPGTKSSNEYTVKRGDTLWDISRKYNVSVNNINLMAADQFITLKFGEEVYEN